MNILRGFLKGLFLALALSVSFVGTRVAMDSQTYLTPRGTVHLVVGERGRGSAVVIAPGFALTAAHVVAGQEKITINGHSVVSYWFDKNYEKSGVDLALVHVPGLVCPCAPLGTSPVLDDRVVSIGYPLSAGQYATEGRIQDIALDSPKQYVSSPIIFGNSGGGTFVFQDFRWRLVGITVDVAGVPSGFGYTFISHIGRIVPISVINRFLADVHHKKATIVDLPR